QEQREKNAILDSFEDGVEEGIKQGLEQGIKQGVEQGIKQGIEQGIKQGVEQGIKQGIEQGQKEGERLLLNRLMESKYHEDCSIWLCSLTMEQLDLVSSLLFTCDTLQELKNQLAVNK
ncbi:hypothetical protein L0P73_22880, partial [[Clostridium] innocuum]|nr:hypothetical protein [[Clostridium] innocuum]